MSARRDYGEGSIRLRKSGLWEARISLGIHDGRRRQRSLYGRSRREVLLKLREELREREAGGSTRGRDMLLRDFLEHWVTRIVAERVRPRTAHRYEQIVRLHILPDLGRRALRQLEPGHIEVLQSRKRREGLSPQMVNHIRAVLHNALSSAVRRRWISYNPAEMVDPVYQPERVYRVYDVAEAARLLRAISGDRLEAAYLVGLSLGLRISEVLGLCWPDLDLQRGLLRLHHKLLKIRGAFVLEELKNPKQRRTLPLPPAARQVLHPPEPSEALRGPWSSLVFHNLRGGPVEASNVTRRLHQIQERAGLERIRFHDLRHSCASILYAQGVDPKTVQVILGHSRLSTTMDIYTHLPAVDVAPTVREATERLARSLAVPASYPRSFDPQGDSVRVGAGSQEAGG